VFRVVAAALLLLAASAAPVRLTAQQAGPAPLQGTVYDSSGAVLPGVEMALVNEQGREVDDADRRDGPVRVRAGRRGQVRARRP
jgi:hypothetical protein